MSREIKFRGWDKSENKMTELPFCISSSGVAHIIRSSKEFNNVVNKFYKKNGDILGGDFAEIDYTDWYAQNLEIMQFTGLKDKNGVEIFESDILTCLKAGVKFGTTEIVEFNNGCFILRHRLLAISDFLTYDHDFEIEVIGNIFENKDLLNECPKVTPQVEQSLLDEAKEDLSAAIAQMDYSRDSELMMGLLPVVRRFMWYDTDDLIDCLPQNRPLYKDSGLWAVRTDDMENVYMMQNCNETLRGFIIRYLEWLEEHGQTDDVWIDLACKKLSS